MDRWFNAHNFPYIKMEDGTYFWQTNVATGEITPEGKIIWHEKNLFEKIVHVRQEKLRKEIEGAE